MARKPTLLETVRCLLVWPLCAANTAVWATLSLLTSLVSGSGRLQYMCMRAWSGICLSLGAIPCRVFGEDRIPEHGPVVIVANHQSMLDILLLAAKIPLPFGWVSKSSLFNVPFLGWHMRRAGYISIDRHRRASSARLLLRAVDQIRAGQSVAIFPEQTRSSDATVGRFHGGAAMLAIRAQVPILPVALRGTAAALPRGSAIVRRSPVSMVVLESIATEGLSNADKAAVTERLRSAIEQAVASPQPQSAAAGAAPERAD